MHSRSLEAMGIPPVLVQIAKAQVAEARRAGLGQVEARRRLADVIAAPGDRDAMQASSAELPVIDMHSL